MSQLPAPPQPPLSKLQQTLRFSRDPYGFLADTRASCGDIFSLDMLGMGRWVFLCNAEHLAELYKLPEEKVLAGKIRQKILAYLFGTHASISLDGEEYSHRRRVVLPFFGGRNVLKHAPLIRQLTEEQMATCAMGDTVELQPRFNRISMLAALRVLLGPLDAEPAHSIAPLAWNFLEALQPPSVQIRPLQVNLGRWNAWGRFVAARDELTAALEAAVDDYIASPDPERDDVLAALCDADLYDDPAKCRLAIAEEIVASVVGGAETTAKVLAWTTLGALQKPEIHQRLVDELDEVLQGEGIGAEHLRQLPYLHAVVQEGMRFQSVGPFAGPRLAEQDIEIAGYKISAGTCLAQCLQEAGRSSFFPNPEEFDPENFLDRKVRPRDWVPFGGGSRLCTGMGLAQLELAVVVGTLFQRFELELVAGSTEPKRSGIAFQPANGLEVRMLGQRPAVSGQGAA